MVWSQDVSPGRTDTSQYRVLLIDSGVNHILSVGQCNMAFFADKISNMDTSMFCSITLLLCVIIQVVK